MALYDRFNLPPIITQSSLCPALTTFMLTLIMTLSVTLGVTIGVTIEEARAQPDHPTKSLPTKSLPTKSLPTKSLSPLDALAAQRADPQKQHIVTLEGRAHNVMVNVTDTVWIGVSRLKSGVFIAEGEFGQERLYGRFKLSGRELKHCAANKFCLFFSGSLELDERGGWADGTSTTFSISLVVSTSEPAVGVYHVGALPNLDTPQYGRLDLKVKP